MDDESEHRPTQPSDLEIIFYLPDHADGKSVPPTNRGSGIPTWERLTDHINNSATTPPRLSVEDCLQLLQNCSGDTKVQGCSGLGDTLIS
jgi:hypothetical protein